MEKFKLIFMQILRYLLAIFMVFAGVQHFLKPDFYAPFVPEFLPFTKFFVFSSGAVEIVLGLILTLKPRFAKYGAIGIFILMLIFLPIHIRDVFMYNPVIGSYKAALIRLPFQFIFLAWSLGVYCYLKKRGKIKN